MNCEIVIMFSLLEVFVSTLDMDGNKFICSAEIESIGVRHKRHKHGLIIFCHICRVRDFTPSFFLFLVVGEYSEKNDISTAIFRYV